MGHHCKVSESMAVWFRLKLLHGSSYSACCPHDKNLRNDLISGLIDTSRPSGLWIWTNILLTGGHLTSLQGWLSRTGLGLKYPEYNSTWSLNLGSLFFGLHVVARCSSWCGSNVRCSHKQCFVWSVFFTWDHWWHFVDRAFSLIKSTCFMMKFTLILKNSQKKEYNCPMEIIFFYFALIPAFRVRFYVKLIRIWPFT
jgi:hypothetical protein